MTEVIKTTKSRTKTIVIVVVVLILVAGLATAGFFLWPRIPKVDVGKVVSDNPSEPYLSSRFSIPLKVTNPNYYSLSIDQITVDVTFANTKDSISRVEKQNVVFPSRATTPLSLDFVLSNWARLSIANACIAGKSSVGLTFKFSVEKKLWFGSLKHSDSIDHSIPCPKITIV